MKYDKEGREVHDPTPVKVTPKIRITPNKLAEFQAMLRTASYLAKNEGFETLEESEDFDVEESDFDPSSPWELEYDPILNKEISKQEAAFLKEQREAFTAKFGKEVPWWKRAFQKRNPKPPLKPNSILEVDPEQAQDDPPPAGSKT